MKHEHKTVAEVLRCARRLIARKDGWTQGAFARGKTGLRVCEHGPAAVSFCAAGAIMKCANDYDQGTAAQNALRHSLKRRSVVDFNDAGDRRKSDVLALFTKAIKCAEEALQAVKAAPSHEQPREQEGPAGSEPKPADGLAFDARGVLAPPPHGTK